MLYTPEEIKKYKANQIIFTSDRLVLIGKKDSVLLNAKKSISLSSIYSINLDTEIVIIAAEKRIDLGLHAKEALILGTTFEKDIIKPLLTVLISLSNTLSTSVNGPSGTPNIGLNIVGVQLQSVIKLLIKKLPNTLSKLTFTK